MVEPIFDYQFRLILIGDSTVGKSSLLKYFTDGRFAEVCSHNPILGDMNQINQKLIEIIFIVSWYYVSLKLMASLNHLSDPTKSKYRKSEWDYVYALVLGFCVLVFYQPFRWFLLRWMVSLYDIIVMELMCNLYYQIVLPNVINMRRYNNCSYFQAIFINRKHVVGQLSPEAYSGR